MSGQTYRNKCHANNMDQNGEIPKPGKELKPKSETGKTFKPEKSPEMVDITVHLTDGSTCSSPWTNREKYLVTVCCLLFAACVSFIVVAFIRDASQKFRATQLLDAMDMDVDPCDDFFEFACGKWNRRYIIPEDKPSFNTFEKLHDDLQVTLKRLLEEERKPYDSESTVKVKILYNSCINVTKIEEIGDEPIQNVLYDLGGWPVTDPNWDNSTFVLEDILGKMRGQYNAPVLLDCWVGADDKNSSANIIQLDQPELGMPSREYYIHDPGSEYVLAYHRYMTRFAILLGANESVAYDEMLKVLHFETTLANVTKPSSERHDTGSIYRKITIKELRKMVPQFDWMNYFSKFIPYVLPQEEALVTFAPEYLISIGKIIARTPKRVIANYIVWRVILAFVPKLTEKYQQARREYEKVLQGVTRDRPRWQKCVEYANENLGMAVGAMFIRDNFKKESKDTAMKMIHNIREAFNELLEENDWMDDETKAVASKKANTMRERIGYPEFIKDEAKLDKKYRELEFEEDEYFKNILKVELFQVTATMKKLHIAVDKEQWEQDPAVVNAFYNPNTNDIVLAAGILQPPFYSRTYPKSLNYGGIGVVIGHEITHGFDDKGRQYDKHGNLKQWWKNDTIEAFRQRAQCMIDQYSNYKLEQIGLNIDGKNTQGENIADNGGLKQSYRAYMKWVEKNGPEPQLPGITLNHQQLFFLNYAQIWCGKMRNEEALKKIRTSVHSPGSIRVLGPLSNSIDFSRAYNCPIGSRMNPRQKCSVW